jgi:hypothetical protein
MLLLAIVMRGAAWNRSFFPGSLPFRDSAPQQTAGSHASVLLFSNKYTGTRMGARIGITIAALSIFSCGQIMHCPGASLATNDLNSGASMAPGRPAAANATFSALYKYRMRGEVRLLLLWLGRNDVGGGHIALGRKPGQFDNSWREEIEILFGANPERIPKKINRWGYGREISEWRQENRDAPPHLLATEFQGVMRHSKESSLDEALANSRQSAAANCYLYDAILNRVSPASASSEIRFLAENEEFDYRRPERLLTSFRESLSSGRPDKCGMLDNKSNVYAAPYGFLTGLSQLILQALEKGSSSSLTFVYNAKPFKLETLSVRPLDDSKLQQEWRKGGAQKVSRIRFRCSNLLKRTRTEFELWIPRSGPLKRMPLRILYQPRWWLRLQLDIDLPNSRFGGGA